MTVLEARSVTRRYDATLALDGVDFDVRAGAVNVLIGENGAGKSTLMKIIAGIEQPDAGTLLLEGEAVSFASVRDAERAGIRIVHQELNLCPNLTVAENIFLGRNILNAGLIDRQAERLKADELLSQFKQGFSADTLVADLRIGQQQIVEIARALLEDARILILDEPTSALSPSEVEVLFELIGDLKARGVAIIYISHRLEELMQIGDYITVLRDGRMQASTSIDDASMDWIIRHMLGESQPLKQARETAEPGELTLSVRDLVLERQAGGNIIDHISCDFYAGQITAIYGLLGSGRTELFEAILGVRRDVQGSIKAEGVELMQMSVAKRVRCGIAMVSEDRQREGLLPNLSVGDNISAGHLHHFSRGGLINTSEEKSTIARIADRMKVKAAGLGISVRSLSGGNQQKVMLGRSTLSQPRTLLIDEPSRGVDIGARAEIFLQLRKQAESGSAIVFSCSDLQETLQYADRILVLANGSITADLCAADASEADLVKACNAGNEDALQQQTAISG